MKMIWSWIYLRSIQCAIRKPLKKHTCRQSPFTKVMLFNLFTTSESPKYSNSNSPNLLLWFFCLIENRANRSGITQWFPNPNLIFFSNSPLKLFIAESIKRIKTKIWRIQIWIFLRFRSREQVIHGKKDKFVCSLFGSIYYAQICLQFYLTFR